MRLGLVWLPPEPISARFCRFAEALTREKRPRIVVGPNKLPHLSLLHIETEESPETFWQEAKAALPSTCPIELFSVGVLRYDTPYNAPAAEPASMAWLLAFCSPALRAVERASLALPSVARARLTTHNGDQFQPHFTIAIWEGVPGNIDPLPKDIADEARFDGRLALGVIGANGVYERTLFEA